MGFFKKLFGNDDEAPEDENKSAVKIPEPAAVTATATADEEDEEELIAVITAAIAASLRKPMLDFRVVSFRKRGDWNKLI